MTFSMSPQRVADAANISPFPPSLIGPPRRPGNSKSDNADRSRTGQHRGRKQKGRTRQERSGRPEEDIRFTFAPKPIHNMMNGRRRPRQGHQDRANNDDDPPPLYEETISLPPVSACPSTTALPDQVAPPRVLNAVSNNVTSRDPRSSTPQESEHDDNYSAGSGDSIDIIGVDEPPLCGSRLEEEIRRDWLQRRGIEFPTPSISAKHTASKVTPSTITRDKDGGRGLEVKVPSSKGTVSAHFESSTPTSVKKKHLSLSPLRTLFPARSSNAQDRAVSADPSPVSPYSSRSISFFRSSASLSTSSILKFPLLSTSVSNTSGRRDSFMSRKLFSFKGKDRESLDSWECLDADDQSPSLMSAVETITDASSPTTDSSPTCAFGSQNSETLSTRTSPTHSARSNDSHQPQGAFPAVNPTPFIGRPVRHRVTPIQTTQTDNNADAELPSPIQTSNYDSPLTPVRAKVADTTTGSPSSIKSRISPGLPLTAITWKTEAGMSSRSTAILQQALDTPLPQTPVKQTVFDYASLNPTTPTTLHAPSPSTPTAGHHAQVFSGVLNNLPNLEASRPNVIKDIPTQDSSGAAMHVRSSQFFAPQNNAPSHSSPNPIMSDSSPSRHHYPGRPLPRPPGVSSATTVDSAGGTSHDNIHVDNSRLPDVRMSDPHCPEGLLIDLDDNFLTGYSTPETSLPHTGEGTRFFAHLPTAFSSADEFFDSIANEPDPCISQPSPPNQRLPTEPLPSSTGGSSEVTDLDLLVSRLEHERQSVPDYETLSLISEFLGPANRTISQINNPGNSANSLSEGVEKTNITFIGRVELERRRVMKDGRVKLKLSLLEVPVDRCGICLSQFKAGELAGLNSVCRHSFHENCLRKWILRNKTCPMCRISLDVDDS